MVSPTSHSKGSEKRVWLRENDKANVANELDEKDSGILHTILTIFV